MSTLPASIDSWLQRYGPFLLAGVAPVSYFWAAQQGWSASAQSIDSFLEKSLELAGVLLGFIATAKALLFAVPDRAVIKLLKRSGDFERIAALLWLDVIVWMATAITGLIFVFAGLDLSTSRKIIGFWCYLPAAGLLSFCRSMGIFAKFLGASSRAEE